jgi:hypothetical protein
MREDALLTMRDLILRSPLLRASRRMKPTKWKTLEAHVKMQALLRG